jgi:dimethylargininase
MLTAITRAVSPSIGDCELTHIRRSPIDVARAVEQHESYRRCLVRLGLRSIELPLEPELPDAVFVEDTAVALDEIAVITRPGAASRRQETQKIAETLSLYLPLKFIRPPATLEGGDVMRIDRALFVGLTSRTNEEGIDQLRRMVEPYDYQVKTVEVNGCLHLKTGCTYLGRKTVLANRRWVDVEAFSDYDLVETVESEPWAANTLRVGELLLLPASHPQTLAQLESLGFAAQALDISELQKAEAGLTCLSVIFDS